MSVSERPTQIVRALRMGDDSAAARLFPVVYAELRYLAVACLRGQRSSHTLQPTALVHEAYLKLVDQNEAAWNDRAHFCAVAARAMRQVLIDHARGRSAAKRGGGWRRVTLEAATDGAGASPLDLLALDEALDQLGAVDERQARIVELRFFAGLTIDEVAEVLDLSPRTVDLDWKMAKAWLSRALAEGDDDAPPAT